MSKRYFTKHVFAERPDAVIEMDVGIGWLPLNLEKARELLRQSKEIAKECDKDVVITLWAENEDGSQEQLYAELPN